MKILPCNPATQECHHGEHDQVSTIKADEINHRAAPQFLLHGRGEGEVPAGKMKSKVSSRNEQPEETRPERVSPRWDRS